MPFKDPERKSLHNREYHRINKYKTACRVRKHRRLKDPNHPNNRKPVVTDPKPVSTPLKNPISPLQTAFPPLLKAQNNVISCNSPVVNPTKDNVINDLRAKMQSIAKGEKVEDNKVCYTSAPVSDVFKDEIIYDVSQ